MGKKIFEILRSKMCLSKHVHNAQGSYWNKFESGKSFTKSYDGEMGSRNIYNALNHCHATYIYVLHSFSIFKIMLTCSIPVISRYFQ